MSQKLSKSLTSKNKNIIYMNKKYQCMFQSKILKVIRLWRGQEVSFPLAESIKNKPRKEIMYLPLMRKVKWKNLPMRRCYLILTNIHLTKCVERKVPILNSSYSNFLSYHFCGHLLVGPCLTRTSRFFHPSYTWDLELPLALGCVWSVIDLICNGNNW